MGLLVNIDNGGTFTDACIADGQRVVHAKSPTTAHDLTQCLIDVLTLGSRELYGEPDLDRIIQDTDYLRYSTTSGTNALIERKGTPVGLIVESGEEDTVYGVTSALVGSEIWQSMVPQRPTGISIPEQGELDNDVVTAAVNAMLSVGVQRIVISLPSPAHEEQIKDILLESYPRHLLGAVPFLISHELAKDTDDARRTLTAVVNSYLHPGMEHFLYGAENLCKKKHLRHPLLIFRNDGNSARVAKTTALKTWGSGPRGGLEGALAYARLYDVAQLLSMDIGGTTTDVSLIDKQQIALLAHGEIADFKTSFALPNLHSFGLGGSSVVSVRSGKIEIGPDSVGAAPGPACFARGGTEATLTDALLLAGVLDPERYLGGELKLDRQRAAQAINTKVADPLALSENAAVLAVIDAFAERAARHLRDTMGDDGRNLQDATLLAYGGGGPMIACDIARAAGIRRIIIPHMSSVFSAFGIGFSALAHEYEVPLGEGAEAQINPIRASLMERAERDMYGEGVDPTQCDYDFSLWSVQGGRVLKSDLNKAGARPGDQGDRRINLKASFALPVFSLAPHDGVRGSSAAAMGSVDLLLDHDNRRPTPIYSDATLSPGETISGPALLRGDYLTCLLEDKWVLHVTPNNDLIIEVDER